MDPPAHRGPSARPAGPRLRPRRDEAPGAAWRLALSCCEFTANSPAPPARSALARGSLDARLAPPLRFPRTEQGEDTSESPSARERISEEAMPASFDLMSFSDDPILILVGWS